MQQGSAFVDLLDLIAWPFLGMQQMDVFVDLIDLFDLALSGEC
mgnify:CR=1 FL=1